MIIIHGEDTSLSYRKLIEITDNLKNHGTEVITYEASEIDINILRQSLSSTNLFGSLPYLILKNLLSSTKSKAKDQIIKFLTTSSDSEIILYEAKELTATTLKPFPKAKIENFKINPLIFKFLDTLRPNNQKAIVLGLGNLLKSDIEPEFVFAMLVRQIRLLIQAKSGPSYLKLAPYPMRLITSQAQYFSLDHLIKLHQHLYSIDLKIKTGLSPIGLEDHLLYFFNKV